MWAGGVGKEREGTEGEGDKLSPLSPRLVDEFVANVNGWNGFVPQHHMGWGALWHGHLLALVAAAVEELPLGTTPFVGVAYRRWQEL